MNNDWRPSFILAFVIFTAVVTSLHADNIVLDGGGAFTISLAIMAVLLVVIHKVAGGSSTDE